MQITTRKISFQKLELVSKILKTIAHPVRMEILVLLETEEPLDVTTIRERLSTDVEQSMLSHHLTKMKDNGVLKSMKDGKNCYYSLCDRHVLGILDCMENCNIV